jgi:hypothetical protein
MTRYTITITEHGERDEQIGNRWEKGAGPTPEEYGYTPEKTVKKHYEFEVFRQTVGELDIEAVVKAVNGIMS